MNEWIEISTPSLRGNEYKYLSECISTNFVSTVGPFINRFEEEVAIKIGVDNKNSCDSFWNFCTTIRSYFYWSKTKRLSYYHTHLLLLLMQFLL